MTTNTTKKFYDAVSYVKGVEPTAMVTGRVAKSGVKVGKNYASFHLVVSNKDISLQRLAKATGSGESEFFNKKMDDSDNTVSSIRVTAFKINAERIAKALKPGDRVAVFVTARENEFNGELSLEFILNEFLVLKHEGSTEARTPVQATPEPEVRKVVEQPKVEQGFDPLVDIL